MAEVSVAPQEWKFVSFDSAVIEHVVATLADELGLDRPILVAVDEATPFGRVRVTSLEPTIELQVEGGALEDSKRPRHLSERATADVLGRVLHRVKDRLDPSFADAPADEDLTLQQSTAWDAYAVGRMGRLGYPVQRQRRLYHFRNRHGFHDVADRVFERLWTSDGLSWVDIQAACDECAEVRAPA